MSLIKCPECGREISDKASTCPGCGCPVSKMDIGDPIYTYRGIDGMLVIYKNRVELKRSGLYRVGRGDSVFPIDKISNVYVYKGTFLTGGFIQILTSGERNAKNFSEAQKSDNAIVFMAGKGSEAMRAKEEIYKLK